MKPTTRMVSSYLRKAIRITLGATALVACAAEPLDPDDEELLEFGYQEEAIQGGQVTSVGELEAVGRVNGGGCTGTLITPTTVLTAGHCVCSGSETTPIGEASTYTCMSRATFTFVDVRQPSDPTTRANATVAGDVVVHPDYTRGAWLSNDYALILLDKRVQEVAYGVQPIQVERPENAPATGDAAQLVGYGRTGVGCMTTGGGSKRRATLPVDSVLVYEPAVVGQTVIFEDASRYSCPGDSGGPALSANGRVIGVASTGNFGGRSTYDATHVVYDWLSDNACAAFDPMFPETAFCNDPMCPCESGTGDCDSDGQCADNGTCEANIGADFGLPWYYDVCIACPTFDASQPNGSFCNDPHCPCAIGEGDCDNDSQCAGNGVCGTNNGPAFGLPVGWDVCIKPGPPCGNGQPDPGEDCDDGNRQPGDGCSATCQEERGWTCPRWNLCFEDIPPCFPRCGNDDLSNGRPPIRF